MTDQTVTRDHPEYRAAVVAGIRELADFIERHTDLPVPQSVGAQYSYLDAPFEEAAQAVRGFAKLMGGEVDITDDAATVRRRIAEARYPSPLPWFTVTYTVHASRDEPTDEPIDLHEGRTTAVAEAKPDTLVQPLGRAANGGA